VIYSFIVSASAFFAFIVVVGARLNLVERRHAHASLGVMLVVAAALCVELTMTFRSSLWWLIGSTDASAGLAEVAVLTLVTTIGCLAATSGVHYIVTRSRTRARP
jgi:hypothetical protein